jgi:hypothetical protein
LTSCRELDDGRLMVEGELKSVRHRSQVIKKPYQVAAEILSFSKRLMNEAIRTFNPDFTEHVATYGDTDSIAGPSLIQEKFQQAGLMDANALCKFKNEYDSYDAKGRLVKQGKCLYEKNHGLKDYCEIVVFSDGSLKGFLKAKGIPLGKSFYEINEETGEITNKGKLERAIPLQEFIDGTSKETCFLSFKRYLPNRKTSLKNPMVCGIERQYATRELHKTPYDKWALDPASSKRYPPGHPLYSIFSVKEEDEVNLLIYSSESESE